MLSGTLSVVCCAAWLLSGAHVLGVSDTRRQVSNLTFFLGDDSSPVLSDAGASAYLVTKRNNISQYSSYHRFQSRQPKGCREISCSTAGAINNCSEVLLDFYNQSKKLSDLDAGNWQESAVDISLCQAGLW